MIEFNHEMHAENRMPANRRVVKKRLLLDSWSFVLVVGHLLICLFSVGCVPNSNVVDRPAAGPDTLRVLAYNIHHGEGMDEVVDLERIAALIRESGADIVALQEMDSSTTRTGHVDQTKELGRLTGMTPVFGPFMAYQGGAYGMALLSRWPVLTSENYRLPDGDEPRTALGATISSPKTGRSIHFVGIHFYRTETERLAQAKSLEEHLADVHLPTILAGDFNSEPNTAVMDHLKQSWTFVTKGSDRLTFSSFDPVKEIDFVMYRPPAAFQVLGEQVLDEPVASDHRPIRVDFLFR